MILAPLYKKKKNVDLWKKLDSVLQENSHWFSNMQKMLQA